MHTRLRKIFLLVLSILILISCNLVPAALSGLDAKLTATPLPVDTAAPGLAATPLPPNQSLAGLIYNRMDTPETWQIGQDRQPHRLIDKPIDAISQDGRSAIYEQDDDLWIADLEMEERRQLTGTPDRVEWSAQWWPENPALVIFQSTALAAWNPAESGYLSFVQVDGSHYSILSETPSIGLPASSPDAKTIAFDQNGIPLLYQVDGDVRAFDPSGFGYPVTVGYRFFSPSWSPDGSQLSWWIETGKPDAKFELVLFDFDTQRYLLVHTYNPPDSTTWHPVAPTWSHDGKWLAYMTRDEASLMDLYISHPDGGESHRFGLASGPVWSPNEEELVFTQWPPKTDPNLAALSYLVNTNSWEPVPVGLPESSLPIAWLPGAPGFESSLALPLFSPPEGWKTYSNPELRFEFKYPSDAVLVEENGALYVNFPFNSGTTLEVKNITIDARPVVEDTCYGGLDWQGALPINGRDFEFRQGNLWEQDPSGLRFYRSDFAAFSNGICYRIAIRMAVRGDSNFTGSTPEPTPGRADLDIEILFNVLSTFRITG